MWAQQQRLYAMFLAVFVLVGLTACAGDGTNDGDLLEKSTVSLTGAGSAGTTQRIIYQMPAVRGGSTSARAIVLLPSGTPPAGGWPVLAWGHGTTGIGDTCAPSDSADLAGYLPYLNGLVGAGFAVVAPDYEGLGVDGLHPYLSKDSEGRSLLYAVLAATRGYPELSKRYALIGHSQGGHAVLGAAALSRELPELSLVGTVAIAPASNIRASGDLLQSVIVDTGRSIQERVQAGVGRLLFSSLILAAIPATDPGFDPASAFGGAATSLAGTAATACLTDLSAAVQSLVQPAIVGSGSIDSLLPPASLNLPAVSNYLAANEPGNRDTGAPVLLLQGSADTTVFPMFTQALNATLTGAGNATTYTEFAGATHTSIVAASATDAATFLATAFASP
ncbi:MAG: alpha/beta fold hydrolase [Burkholderiaceae bacterium]